MNDYINSVAWQRIGNLKARIAEAIKGLDIWRERDLWLETKAYRDGRYNAYCDVMRWIQDIVLMPKPTKFEENQK